MEIEKQDDKTDKSKIEMDEKEDEDNNYEGNDDEDELSPRVLKKRGRPKKTVNGTEIIPSAKKSIKKQKVNNSKNKVTKDEEIYDNDSALSENGKKDKKPKKKSIKPKKISTAYKKGKFNPDITIIEKCELLESTSNQIIDYDSFKINNKNIIRAAYTRNHDLLKEIMQSKLKISSFYDVWGPENDFNAIELIFKNNDETALKLFLEAERISQYSSFSYIPTCGLKEIQTGYNSFYTFGVKVRKVQMMRGGREGNNAFVGDLKIPSELEDKTLDKIFEYDIDPKMFEILRAGKEYMENKIDSRIHLAVRSGNRKLAGALIQAANKRSGFGYNFLHEEVLVLDDPSKLSDIKKVNCTKKPVGEAIITPIHCACINPNPKFLEALLAAAPEEYSHPDELMRKPIHYAAACEGPEPLEILLKKGVDAREGDQLKNTPLMIAAKYGRTKNIGLLLKEEGRSNINAKNKEGMMAIHFAAIKGQLNAIKVLHEHGANLNTPGKLRMTPLILAAAYNHYDCVVFLAENKAKILSKDKFKRSALAIACRNGNLKIASYLLQQ